MAARFKKKLMPRKPGAKNHAFTTIQRHYYLCKKREKCFDVYFMYPFSKIASASSDVIPVKSLSDFVPIRQFCIEFVFTAL